MLQVLHFAVMYWKQYKITVMANITGHYHLSGRPCFNSLTDFNTCTSKVSFIATSNLTTFWSPAHPIIRLSIWKYQIFDCANGSTKKVSRCPASSKAPVAGWLPNCCHFWETINSERKNRQKATSLLWAVSSTSSSPKVFIHSEWRLILSWVV